ncbi:MAG: MBG domain-containing protein [Planctomycetota bacterium]|nr:MBG domain-containing protein [Planctomycetota bacterium]
MTIESLEPLVMLAPVLPMYGLADASLGVSVSSSPPVGSIVGSGVIPVIDTPASHVDSLPVITRTMDFQVTWSGQAAAGGSGIVGYNIYVSTDDGSYVLWKPNVTETSAMFNDGQNGHTYRFYSEAIDQSGKHESPPTAADATTTIGDIPTTISVSITTNHPHGSVYGEAVTFMAIVSADPLAAGAPPRAGLPTGFVQCEIDGTPFGVTTQLSGGFSQWLPVDLAAGSHSVAIRYTSNSTNFANSVSSSLNLIVDQAVLDVRADDQEKVYGSDNWVLTGSIAGLQNGDPITVSFSTTATSASSVGFYPISPVLSDPAGKLNNYRLVIVEGALSVVPAPLTIAVDDQTKVYGAALPALTASYSGFVNGDTAASLTTPPSLVTTVTVGSHVGDYPITASGAVASDYAISYLPGWLTVTPVHGTIDQAADQTNPTKQAPIHFTAVFHEPVSDFTAESLALGGTAQGSLVASASPLGSDGTTFDVVVSGMTGSGTVTVGLAAGNSDLIVTSTNNTVTYRPWQNVGNPMDVNNQGSVTPLAVLLIINYINAYGAGPLPTPPPSPGPPPYLDVDGDGQVTAQDVLAVINYINSQNVVGTVQPEGESASRPAGAPVASPPGGQSPVAANDTPPALTPAITQRASEMGTLTPPPATRSVSFSLARTATAQAVASLDIAAALLPSATSQLRSAEWETLLDGLAERGTRRGNRPDQVDQVFAELAADLAPG